jgi:hypothetical protein
VIHLFLLSIARLDAQGRDGETGTLKQAALELVAPQ